MSYFWTFHHSSDTQSTETVLAPLIIELIATHTSKRLLSQAMLQQRSIVVPHTRNKFKNTALLLRNLSNTNFSGQSRPRSIKYRCQSACEFSSCRTVFPSLTSHSDGLLNLGSKPSTVNATHDRWAYHFCLAWPHLHTSESTVPSLGTGHRSRSCQE